MTKQKSLSPQSKRSLDLFETRAGVMATEVASYRPKPKHLSEYRSSEDISSSLSKENPCWDSRLFLLNDGFRSEFYLIRKRWSKTSATSYLTSLRRNSPMPLHGFDETNDLQIPCLIRSVTCPLRVPARWNRLLHQHHKDLPLH